jgi:hypothetical protein
LSGWRCEVVELTFLADHRSTVELVRYETSDEAGESRSQMYKQWTNGSKMG